MGPALEKAGPEHPPGPGAALGSWQNQESSPLSPGEQRGTHSPAGGRAGGASDEGLGQASHSRMGKLRCGQWVDLPSCQRVRGWFLPQPWPAGGTEAFAGRLRAEGPVSEPLYLGGRAGTVPTAALLRTCRHKPWVSTGSGTGGPATEKSLVGWAAGARQGLSPRSGFCAALTQCCKSRQEGWPRALGGPGVGALEGPSCGKRGFLGSRSPRNPSALTRPRPGPRALGGREQVSPSAPRPRPQATRWAWHRVAPAWGTGSGRQVPGRAVQPWEPCAGRARGGEHIPSVLQLPPEWRARSQACRPRGLHGRGHLRVPGGGHCGWEAGA